MTEFGTLEIVTDLEVKGQQTEPKCETLDPVQSHTPTPPPETQSQLGMAAASSTQNQPGSSQAKGKVFSMLPHQNFLGFFRCFFQ